MARELYEFDVTTPAGTPKATPQVSNLLMPARIVRRITVKVPPGPNGQLGFAVGMVGVPVIPANAGAFIVTSDESIIWDVSDLPESGAWQVLSYNTGLFPHTIYTRWEVDLVQGSDTSAAPQLLIASSVAPVVTVGSAGAGPGTTDTGGVTAAGADAAVAAALTGGGQ